MTGAPTSASWPAPPIFPPRRRSFTPSNSVDRYLAELDGSLSGQIDPALEQDGIIAPLGRAPKLGIDLLVARRRRAVEAWQRGSESIWWWTEPLIPVAVAVAAVFMAAIAPTIAVIAGMAAQPTFGEFAIVLVPLVMG